MKATGIIRRMDDLGRIVIPKEIRRALCIQEGDPLEIMTDEFGNIIIQKYDSRERAVVNAIESVRDTFDCEMPQAVKDLLAVVINILNDSKENRNENAES